MSEVAPKRKPSAAASHEVKESPKSKQCKPMQKQGKNKTVQM